MKEESDQLPAPLRLGGALRRAWVGYQRRLDEELTAAGFADRGLPDGRVLRICSRSTGVTVSDIGREIGITRQGASKLVSGLERRGYLALTASATDGREKVVSLTPRALEFLQAHRRAAQRIEKQVKSEIGPDAFAGLWSLLDALGGPEQPRMRDYLIASRTREGHHPFEG